MSSKALASAALVWCVGISVWLARSGQIALPALSLLVLLAAFGTWAVWRGRTPAIWLVAGLFVAFSIATGFSIGVGYLPVAAAFLWSAFISLELQRD